MWRALLISPDKTHHLCHGVPAYKARFDEVLSFHAIGLAPVSKDNQAWHINLNGNPAYSKRFLRTFGFYEDCAAVQDNDGWYHIHPSGEAVYSQRYIWCGNYQGERCTVRTQEGEYFHIKSNGHPAYPSRWQYAGDFRDGIAVVQASNGYSTHIDADGNPLHDQWFLDLDVFHKFFARARDQAGWFHISKDGNPLYSHRFAMVEPFYNGQARVERFDGGMDVIDQHGITIIELRPAQRSEFAMLSKDMVGFWSTQTIAAAVELGIMEHLPATHEHISQVLHLHTERVSRLLHALGELSLVTYKNTLWQSTPRGEYLRKAHPLTLADAALEYAHYFPDMWKSLPTALRQNGEWQTPKIFEQVSTDGLRPYSFHRMLSSYAQHDYADVPSALNLKGDERVIDAGGGLGVLAQALLKTHPNIQLFLLEKPEVIKQAQQQMGVIEQLTYLPRDFFEPWEVQADAVILARVVHDWDELSALQILKNARKTLSKGGKLFLIEMVMSEDNHSGALCDLHLLMVTGGKERTRREYTTLLDQAGFGQLEIRHVAALPSVLVAIAQ